MILIPEIRTIVLLVPRTASGTIKRAILRVYPDAIPLYRHMEADGVPAGYDRWEKVGLVREPVERLWSLFKFCADPDRRHQFTGDNARILNSTRRPFSDWIVENEVVFSNAFGPTDGAEFYPHYTVMHSLPENRKSQFVTLRPDLGTTVYRFTELAAFADRLGINLVERHNSSSGRQRPNLSPAAQDHVQRFFAWDIEASGTAGTT